MKKNYVFTYGTLLRGERNHRLINDEDFVCEGLVEGFKMFSLGYYPGIEKGEGIVLGELYLVDDKTLARLDELEDEGRLYLRETISVHTLNKEYIAYVYVYNQPINNPMYLGDGVYSWKSLKDEYVWYASYGSNLLLERFLLYITGGFNDKLNIKQYGCNDKSMPLMSKQITIPYELYFGNESKKWNRGGVAFVDADKKGNTIGRAYLIKKSQLDDIQNQEGKWYSNKLKLDSINGIETYTLTSSFRYEKNCVCDAYEKVILNGLIEMGIDPIEGIQYLKSHM